MTDTSKSLDLQAHPMGASPAASKDAPTDEAVMVNIAGNAQDLERAKEHARLLLKRVAAGPVGDGLSHAEYALLCLYAHVATLTAQLEAERAEFSVDRTCNGNLQVGEDESVLAREIDVVVVAKKCVYVDDHRIAGSKPYVSENLPQHSLKTTIEHALAPFSSSVLMAALCKRDPALRSEYTTALTRETARADAAVAEAKDAMLANAALREALKEVLSWHDYTDDMHKPVEVRAAYMRARATLAQPADGGK